MRLKLRTLMETGWLMIYTLLCNCGQNIGCKPDILTAYRPLTVTLFRSALEPGLLCALACFPSAFLAVRCLQSDRQSGLVQRIDYAALGEGFFQAAKVGVLLAERCQPLPQPGIVGLDVGGVLTLVEQDNGLFLILRQGHIRHPPFSRRTATHDALKSLFVAQICFHL